MTDPVTFQAHGLLAEAIIDNAPVNALSHAVRAGLLRALERFEQDDQLQVLLIRSTGRFFSAGADVTEFGKPMQEPVLPQLLVRLDGCTKPVVAGLQGTALGGGLELALACHYRIAAAGVRLGFPEVKLGLLPGAGGTQRTPRLAGLDVAISMIAEGRELDAAAGKVAGLVDEVADGEFVAVARGFAQRVARSGPRPSRTLPMPAEDTERFALARKTLTRRHAGEPAPLMALDAIRLGYSLPFDEALAREYELCVTALKTPESRALRHLFAAQRRVTQPPAGATARAVDTVAVVGLGTMGRGIVIALAEAGVTTLAVGSSAASIERGRKKLAAYWDKRVAKGKCTPERAVACQQRIRFTVALPDVGGADFVIEAISEDLAAKQALFTRLGQITRPGTILASNTSYLDINALGVAAGRPAEVCGLHFFNPANVMRLLECIRADATSADVLATAMGFARRIGKLPVVSGVCEGFIVNRLLAVRSRESYFLIEEGASPLGIDTALTKFGFPMGALALGDLAGLDLQLTARKAREARLTPREQRANFIGLLVAEGRLGQKSGAGWYRYDENRRAQPDPEVDRIIAEHARRNGLVLREIGAEEIIQRLLYAMVNEGAKLLDEGIVSDPAAIDVALVNGVRFPAYRGGPLYWADSIGLPAVLKTIERFRAAQGDAYWTPARRLVECAAAGHGFYGA
ncbi:MAG TPA: 3-hydroxyacyl-CoA dehydrogenase NAD-binding domain-containing protein [Nevskiaceae bacterium]|nr:3-hydroxyacyl-CoA dehydrogenase NAD-binding domain-containing protein [Nevskiaceae bacterium]